MHCFVILCSVLTDSLCTCVGPSIPYTGAYFGQGTGLIILGGLTCSGTETSLLECSSLYSIDSVQCYHYWDAGVSCSQGAFHV